MGRKCREEQLVLNCKSMKLDSLGERWNVWFRNDNGVVSIWNEGLHGHKELYSRMTSKFVKAKGKLYIDFEECGDEVRSILEKVGKFTGNYRYDGYERLPEFIPGENFVEYVEKCG